MSSEWVVQELGGVDLGDERRTERLVELTTSIAETPGGALSQACPDEASFRAATRFLDNPNFEDADLLQEHLSQTIQRIRPFPLIYVPQDSTSMNYKRLKATEGLGRVGVSNKATGIYLHSTLAITPDRIPLGIIHQTLWFRTKPPRGAGKYRDLPIEEKESFKWLQSLKALNELAIHCPETIFISMGDREADIYEMLVHPREANVELLIRAVHNRKTKEGDQEGKLWDELRAAPVVASMTVHIPKQTRRPERQAHLEVHYKKVTVMESKRMRENKRLSTGIRRVEIWVVLAEEKHPPKSLKRPLRWMLYSTRPIETAEEATAAIEAYSRRWVIEVWHKTLKSSLKIEQKQAKTGRRLARHLTLASLIAWRIMYIMHLSREEPDLPCTVCFEENEWKAAWVRHHRNAQCPNSPPGLRDFIRMLCKLSGFMGRKNEGEPGVIRIGKALDYLTPMAETYRVLTQSSSAFPASSPFI